MSVSDSLSVAVDVEKKRSKLHFVPSGHFKLKQKLHESRLHFYSRRKMFPIARHNSSEIITDGLSHKKYFFFFEMFAVRRTSSHNSYGEEKKWSEEKERNYRKLLIPLAMDGSHLKHLGTPFNFIFITRINFLQSMKWWFVAIVTFLFFFVCTRKTRQTCLCFTISF